MLKIKDNVDLKELEKFGFKPRYDENTGKIIIYKYYKQGEYLEDCPNTETIITINVEIRELRFFSNYKIDILYDLIQAGLVEKIEE